MNSVKPVNAPLSEPDEAPGGVGSPRGVELPPQHPQSLLETIRRIRARAGDALAEEELTFFLQGWDLPEEEGFTFLCFHDGCVTLAVPAQYQTSRVTKACEFVSGSVTVAVPAQDKTCRHPRSAWITPAREKIATELARKHGLFCL